MLVLFLEKGPWFRAKRFGHGAGLPFKWQGWVALALYALLMLGIALLSDQFDGSPKIAVTMGMLAVTVVFLIIVRNRTEGGWKWRS